VGALSIHHTNGDILVTDTLNHRVQILTKHGGHLKIFGSYGPAPSQLSHPHGIALTAKGDILIADTCNQRVCLYCGLTSSWEAAGQVLKMMTASSSWMAADVHFLYPLGVAVNREGQIVVSDWKRSGLSWLSLDVAPRALLSWAAYGWYQWAPHCPPHLGVCTLAKLLFGRSKAVWV